MIKVDKKIIDFIGYAKKQSYASATSKPKRTKDGGKKYTVKKNGLVYTDTYFGNLIDCGQEMVYLKGKVVWVMAYRGRVVKGFESISEEAFNFLKRCISKIPKDFPVRGPKKITEGKFVYKNKWKGNIKGFVGEENIYYNGKKVCFRNYIGGLIKNKK